MNEADPPQIVAVRAYLLGTLPVGDALTLQRRLAYEIGGVPHTAAVVVCEHPYGVTIGRNGSRAHVRLTAAKLAARRWPVDYVGRGGGCVLHAPGQVACYPILPLQTLGLTPAAYVATLTRLVGNLVSGFGVTPAVDEASQAVRANGRRVASFGVAVRDWVTTFGFVVNVAPDLAYYRDVDCDGDPLPMTSLQRECPGRVRVATVRQRLLELLAGRFRLGRVSVFHSHPTMVPRAPRHALPTAG